MLSRASSNTTMPLASGTAPARRSERPRALAGRAHKLLAAQCAVGAHHLRWSCGGHGRRTQTTPRLHCTRRTQADAMGVSCVSRARGGEVGAQREQKRTGRPAPSPRISLLRRTQSPSAPCGCFSSAFPSAPPQTRRLVERSARSRGPRGVLRLL